MAPDDGSRALLDKLKASWQDTDARPAALRRLLDERDKGGTPSYRVGAAEGFSLFVEIGDLAELVEESTVSLQARGARCGKGSTTSGGS